ncbi:sensor histidine kinase [Enemella sp. A6]|uniref:sensor histidine kinase n=1 Tax=Enemella sp. A6 TaxID=3440152 RepID=UPI003EB95A87
MKRSSSTDPTMRSLGAALLATAGVTALLGAVYHADRGRDGPAIVLAIAALVTTAASFGWFRGRGTTTGKWLAVGLLPASYLTWLLADNTTGVPLMVVAVCALVVEFGTRAGVLAGVALMISQAGLYAVMNQPQGGRLENWILTAAMVGLGLLAAQVVARLERARLLAEEAARSRRDEAMAELDRALAADRMEHARALHDDLGQRLTLIGMGLDLAGRIRQQDPDAAWAEVERTREAASEALAELRTMVRALSPLTTDEAVEVDLDAALTRLAGAFTGTGLEVSLVRGETSSDQGLDPLAYRIIQESLTNVVRHSDAGRVTVAIESGDEQIVRVSDDGTHSADGEPGFGLRNLRARVESVGGTFTAGREDHGFVVSARFPAQSPARVAA